ncbi:Rieske (2Fe-2S) protein [Aridibaculum aurantiacum]|uniref:Rieske (2Fe-2S) protein n=1 Tax=Aridibaculum aurantiacum TaxID=2810307 RepID=UPI001A965C11|nr:Rieske 2Fe-2S domain-containing protein [Aridibaculum aurantiacum]
MAEKKIKWHKLTDHIDAIGWQPNGLAVVEVGSKTVTLARIQDSIKACAHKCPHASGILANGFLDALGNIVCPLHRYKFSLDNGRNITGEGYYLKVYPVETREAGIFIGFEENNWLDIFR